MALVAGAMVVPPRRWLEALWPLAMGVVVGLLVVVSGAGEWRGWPPWLGVGVALGASALHRRASPASLRWLAVVAVAVVAACTVWLTLRPPVGPGPHPSADQSETLAWSAAADAWRTSAVEGLGPPRIDINPIAVATYPGLLPDVYLTVVSQGGLIGALLLLGAGAWPPR
jgi:hypothetical protein